MSEDKSKIKITEKEYQSKLCNCTGSAIQSAVVSSVAAAAAIPVVFGKLRSIIPTNTETKLAVAIACALPIGYFVAGYVRKECLRKVEDNYVY